MSDAHSLDFWVEIPIVRCDSFASFQATPTGSQDPAPGATSSRGAPLSPSQSAPPHSHDRFEEQQANSPADNTPAAALGRSRAITTLCRSEHTRARETGPASAAQSSRSSAGAQQQQQFLRRNKRYFCPSGSRWTDEQDAILRDSVRRHGNDWFNVLARFNQLSGTAPRTVGSLQGRLSVLRSTRGAKSQACKAMRLEASSSSRSRQYQRWSEEETSTLRCLLLRHQDAGGRVSYRDVYKEFLAHFPRSARTCAAISEKCRILQRAAHRGGRENSRASSESYHPVPSTAAASQGQESMLLAVERSSVSLSGQDDDAASTMPPAVGSTASPAAASPPSSADSRQQPQRDLRAQGRENPTAGQGIDDDDVDVFHESNGVRVLCPPGYEVRVVSHSHVQVRRYVSRPRQGEVDAIFHLRVLEEDGSIQALRMPPNTTASIDTIPSGGGSVIRWRDPSCGYWVSVCSSRT